MQILGQDTYYILKAMNILKDYEFDILDLNAGCPQRKKIGAKERFFLKILVNYTIYLNL